VYHGQDDGDDDLLSESAMISAMNQHNHSVVRAGGMVHDIYRDPNVPEVLLARFVSVSALCFLFIFSLH